RPRPGATAAGCLPSAPGACRGWNAGAHRLPATVGVHCCLPWCPAPLVVRRLASRGRTAAPTRALHSVTDPGGQRRFGEGRSRRTARSPAHAHGGERAAVGRGRAAGCRGRRRRGAAVVPAAEAADRQAGGRDGARWPLPQRGGLVPALHLCVRRRAADVIPAETSPGDGVTAPPRSAGCSRSSGDRKSVVWGKGVDLGG